MDEDQETLLTRRRLLATGAVVVAGVTLPQTSASAKTYAAGAKNPKPLARYARGYRRARFAPHVGAPVELRPRGGAVVRGTLAGIQDVPYVKGLAGDEDVYTLRFLGPANPLLPEGIVGIRNPHFGVVELYVTPVASGPDGHEYLAQINRRVPRSARPARRALRS